MYIRFKMEKKGDRIESSETHTEGEIRSVRSGFFYFVHMFCVMLQGVEVIQGNYQFCRITEGHDIPYVT